VSTLDERGAPSVTQRCLIRPPMSRLGPATEAEREAIQARSPVAGVYDETIDRDSAHERLRVRAEEVADAEAGAARAERERKRAPAPAPAPRAPARRTRQTTTEALRQQLRPQRRHQPRTRAHAGHARRGETAAVGYSQRWRWKISRETITEVAIRPSAQG
jgi:hypothetical protein